MMKSLRVGGWCLIFLVVARACAADMPDMWTKDIGLDARLGRPDTRWFEEAKFGLFIHWGLYSALGNEWQGRSYYGSGEWLMNRAKIPAAEYAALARDFNPTGFDAAEWARFAREAGMRYMVVTAKHHEGFAMFGSRASPFNIVAATPYAKDPMTALAAACAREQVKFGFYYSQFLDWHEPNGGGNRWDFDEKKKDVKRYYAEKSIPQIKELLSNYGPVGLVWFDMPGGLTREETVGFMQEVRRLQPGCLVSSRVGQGLGDFRDFGDSELPPRFITGPWEALFTHNDSWGFVRSDRNFKTPREIIQLLAATSARGGNLLLNVGPDGSGRMPETSVRYLREVGRWLAVHGESIYGTTHSPLPDQPWGVSTRKADRLFLHVFTPPRDGRLFVPGIAAAVKDARFLGAAAPLAWRQSGGEVEIALPATLPDARDSVIALEFAGAIPDQWDMPAVVGRNFERFTLEAARAAVSGQVALKSQTHSRYYGNWKHDTCAVGFAAPGDRAEFALRFLAPGDYRVTLEYACPRPAKVREGVVTLDGQPMPFETLLTAEYDKRQPLLFVRHAIGIVTVAKAGPATLSVQPRGEGTELFWLRSVTLEPVD
jgi:alpha-L-fucosidase